MATDEVRDLLADLVRLNSVNPGLMPGAPGEAAIAEYVGDFLRRAGLEVARHEAVPGRPSVVGMLSGRRPGPTLMLHAHLDTVGVAGMPEPFTPRVEGGKLFGRGACDMKSGLAANLLAARSLAAAGWDRGTLLVAALADEEDASLGTTDLLRRYRCDGAIVTETTQLTLCLAHKGFSWIEVAVRGRAAHGSRFDLGVDANLRLGRLFAPLASLESTLLRSTPHPLVGPPSLHVPLLRGGTGPSTYADQATLMVERRTIPGTPPGRALEEIQQLVAALRREDPTLDITVTEKLERRPFENTPESPLARTVRRVMEDTLGSAPAITGETPWMDSALLAAAGMDTVIVGPRGGGAHAMDEWVELDSVGSLWEILVGAARQYCGGEG